jgi:multicomponent K+:H+ antiporter subunit E
MSALVVVTGLLLGLWVLLRGSAEPGQLLLGLLVAGLASRLAVGRVRRRLGPQLRPWAPQAGPAARLGDVLGRLWSLLRWLQRLVVDIVVANFRIAALVADPRRRPQPVCVELPLTLESPLGIYLLAATISLTPGTLTVDLVHGGSRRLLVHAIDRSELAAGSALSAPDAAAWASAVKARYEAPLLEVFR